MKIEYTTYTIKDLIKFLKTLDLKSKYQISLRKYKGSDIKTNLFYKFKEYGVELSDEDLNKNHIIFYNILKSYKDGYSENVDHLYYARSILNIRRNLVKINDALSACDQYVHYIYSSYLDNIL